MATMEALITRWEYKTVGLRGNSPEKHERELNEVGAHGWELVNVVEAPRGNWARTSSKTVAYFKRAVFA